MLNYQKIVCSFTSTMEMNERKLNKKVIKSNHFGNKQNENKNSSTRIVKHLSRGVL